MRSPFLLFVYLFVCFPQLSSFFVASFIFILHIPDEIKYAVPLLNSLYIEGLHREHIQNHLGYSSMLIHHDINKTIEK